MRTKALRIYFIRLPSAVTEDTCTLSEFRIKMHISLNCFQCWAYPVSLYNLWPLSDNFLLFFFFFWSSICLSSVYNNYMNFRHSLAFYQPKLSYMRFWVFLVPCTVSDVDVCKCVGWHWFVAADSPVHN